jgi:hypothetical protein
LNTLKRESDGVGIVAVWIKPVPRERGFDSLEAAPGGAKLYPIATRLARSSHNRNICLIFIAATLAEAVRAFHHIQLPEFTVIFRPAMSPGPHGTIVQDAAVFLAECDVDFGTLGAGP